MTYRTEPSLSTTQKQIVLGTLMGGSSCVKPKRGRNSYLSMRGRDLNWLKYKATELADLASEKPITIEDGRDYCRWHSLSFSVLNDFRGMFYGGDGKRVVSPEVLDQLCDTAWAVWYGDSGRVLKGHRIQLNTTVHGEDGTAAIAEYLNRFNHMHADVLRAGAGWRITFDESGSREFVRVMGHRLPPFMIERLDREWKSSTAKG